VLVQRKTIGRLEGSITYNGHRLSSGEMQRCSAYVLQEVRGARDR
jgi:hypothetical protein